MSKIHWTNVHILPDENLGGVLREYVEVDRNADVGDLVTIDGIVRKVTSRSEVCEGVEFDEYYDDVDDEYIIGWADGSYKTLEPTDIVHIDGVRYRMVDRKAKVGEKVLDLLDKKTPVKEIVKEFRGYVWYEYQDEEGTDIAPIQTHEYRVLEPIEPTELVTAEEGDDKSVIDLLANLARRVTVLERKLGEYARKVDGMEADIQNINIDLGTVEENVEMILDDIVTLDERTQPLVALVKAVKGDE